MTVTKLLGLLRDVLVADGDILDKLDYRVYSRNNFSVLDAEFPCIVSEFIPGNWHEPSDKASFDWVRYYIYSDVSEDECFEIYELVTTALKNQYYENDNYKVNIYSGIGDERPDIKTDWHPQKEVNLYFCTVRYRITSVNQN